MGLISMCSSRRIELLLGDPLDPARRDHGDVQWAAASGDANLESRYIHRCRQNEMDEVDRVLERHSVERDRKIGELLLNLIDNLLIYAERVKARLNSGIKASV